MNIDEITFEDILPYWRDKLWPNRDSLIEPASSMLYLGGYDVNIKVRYSPRFFAVRFDGKIVGVNSGHQTNADFYRSRGIFVDPNIYLRGVGRMLIEAVEKSARDAGCKNLWSIPRQSAMSFYARCGFHQTSDFFDEHMEFGPNAYALKEL